jgi:hypothetical protein
LITTCDLIKKQEISSLSKTVERTDISGVF